MFRPFIGSSSGLYNNWSDCFVPTGSRMVYKQSQYRPWKALRVPAGWRSQILRQSAHEGGKIVRPTHRPPLPPGNILGTHFCYRLNRPQGHSATGRIMSMKKSSDTVGNWTRDLPVCSAMPQPPRHRVPPIVLTYKIIWKDKTGITVNMRLCILGSWFLSS
jgi:hypothetical protein